MVAFITQYSNVDPGRRILGLPRVAGKSSAFGRRSVRYVNSDRNRRRVDNYLAISKLELLEDH